MRLALHILGTEVLAITTEDEAQGAPDFVSMPMGFSADHGDQRWQKGLEP